MDIPRGAGDAGKEIAHSHGDGDRNTVASDSQEDVDRPPADISGNHPVCARGEDVELLCDVRSPTLDTARIVASIIIPVHNGEPFLDECLGSLVPQGSDFDLSTVQVCAHDDMSSDRSPVLLKQWAQRLVTNHSGSTGASVDGRRFARFVATRSRSNLGPGGARNCCVMAARMIDAARKGQVGDSHGGPGVAPVASRALVFLDCDDLMAPGRLAAQVARCLAAPRTLVGGCFVRVPVNATVRYADWANAVDGDTLYLDQYRECTTILPTWCCSELAFDAAGPFPAGVGVAEDLSFFHAHLSAGGGLDKVDRVVTVYRHVPGSVSFRTPRKTLIAVRARNFERRVLRGAEGPAGRPHGGEADRKRRRVGGADGDGDGCATPGDAGTAWRWPKFTIWGAGRDGKAFFHALSDEAKSRVAAFCDVDPGKIRCGGYRADKGRGGRLIPIVHFSDAEPPFAVCVAKGRVGDDLQRNVATKEGVVEGENLWYIF